MGDPSCCQWVEEKGGVHPKYAVHAGIDGESKLYVARAKTKGTKIPGKLHVSHGVTYVCYNGKEKGKKKYEVLIAPPGSLSWLPSGHGEVPHNAVPGGEDPSGETYYIGRAITHGTVTIGKVHPSHGCLYVPYDGEELSFTEYEILVRNMYGQFLGV